MKTKSIILTLLIVFVSYPVTFAQKIHWVSTTESAPWQQVKHVPDFKTGVNNTDEQISIYQDSTLQGIDGFGACFNELGWEALQSVKPEARQKVLDNLFLPKESNFSYCRMPVAANDYSLSYYSYDDVPKDFNMDNFNIDRDRYILIPYIHAAQKIHPGLKIWASPWSPPAWMKINQHYALHRGPLHGHTNGLSKDREVSDNATAFRMEDRYLKAYALYLSKFVQAYKKQGIDIKALDVQNEIVYTPHWSSCTWRPEDLSYFIRDYLGPQFKKDSLTTQIWLGTVNSADPNYVRTVLNNKKTAKYISGIGYQWDAKRSIPFISKEYPQYRSMQTESECGNHENNWKSAEYTWSLINHYMNYGVNSYMYWNMVLDQTGKSTWDWPQNSLISINKNTKVVTYHPEYYLMKHLSHFILPGAHRLKTSGGKDHLAFVNPDGTTVLILVNNDNADKNIDVNFAGKTAVVTVKAKSFNTLMWK